MSYIVSAIWITFELFSLYFACKAFLFQRKRSRVTIAFLLIFGVVIFIMRNFVFSVFPNKYYARAASLAVGICFTLIAFQGSWFVQLAVVIIHYFFVSAFDTITVYGTASLLSIAVSELIWRKWLYTVVVSAGKGILLFFAWGLYYYMRRKANFTLSRKRLLLITIFPLVSIIMLFVLFDGFKTQEDLSIGAVVFSIILGISNIAVIYLMNSLERTAIAEQEVAVLNQSMKLQTENIVALEKSYRAQRGATHEFKHHLQVISDLLQNGKNFSAQEYIAQLQSAQTSRVFAVNTNHPIVDAILNEKYHVAKDADIDIHYKVNDLSTLSVATDSLVVLLSNLLDNAIEGCLRLPDNRMLECTLLLDDEILFLSIRNTSPPVIIVNGEVGTTKENKSEHGFGLASVRRVLKQLDGEYAMDFAGNWFEFVAEIPRN